MKDHLWFSSPNNILSTPLPINLPLICSFFVYTLHSMCCIPFSGEEWMPFSGLSALGRTLLFQVLFYSDFGYGPSVTVHY